jgi:hypothetical protein
MSYWCIGQSQELFDSTKIPKTFVGVEEQGTRTLNLGL